MDLNKFKTSLNKLFTESLETPDLPGEVHDEQPNDFKQEDLHEVSFKHTCPDGTIFNVSVKDIEPDGKLYKVSDQSGKPIEEFTDKNIDNQVADGVPVEKKKMIVNDYKTNYEGKQKTDVAVVPQNSAPTLAPAAAPVSAPATSPSPGTPAPAEVPLQEVEEIIKKFEKQYPGRGKEMYYATANAQGRSPETFKKMEELQNVPRQTASGEVVDKKIEGSDIKSPENHEEKTDVNIVEDKKEEPKKEIPTEPTKEAIPVEPKKDEEKKEPEKAESKKEEAKDKVALDPEKAVQILTFVKTEQDLDDKNFHIFVKDLKVDPHEAEEIVYAYVKKLSSFLDLIKTDDGEEAKILGGVGDELTPEDVDPEQLEMGIKVEMEHIKNNKNVSEELKQSLAQDIALDHLKEIPDYYTRLAEMETTAKAELGTSDDGQGSPEIEPEMGVDDSGEIENDDLSDDEEAAVTDAGFKMLKENVDFCGKSIRESAIAVVKSWTPEDWESFKKSKSKE